MVNKKTCSYALFALKSVGQSVYRLVRVDTATGQSIDDLPFPEVYGTGGFLKADEQSYYTLRTDSNGYLLFTRYDLINRTTRVFTGPNWGVSRVNSFDIAYSTLSSKFYFLYSNPGTSIGTYKWQFCEISLNGSAFTFYGVQLNLSPNMMMAPLVSDPSNGKIYFQSMGDYLVFIPGNKDAAPLMKKFVPIQSFQVCQNDGLLYGIGSDAYGVLPAFKRFNPAKSEVVDVSDLVDVLEPVPTYTSFDQCRSQYIIQNGSDSIINLFWLDTKDGSVKKHLTVNDRYLGIMCVGRD